MYNDKHLVKMLFHSPDYGPLFLEDLRATLFRSFNDNCFLGIALLMQDPSYITFFSDQIAVISEVLDSPAIIQRSMVKSIYIRKKLKKRIKTAELCLLRTILNWDCILETLSFCTPNTDPNKTPY